MFHILKNKRGMTLIEIMIVLAILGSIMALLLPRVTGGLDKSKVREVKIGMGMLMNSLSMYYTDCGKYPATIDGLTKADANCSNWGPEPYAKESQLKDPWGNPYLYELNGQEFVLTSYGKDGREGGSSYNSDISSTELDK